MARSMTITAAKIDRVLKAMVNNGIAIKEIDIMADKVVLVTENSPECAAPQVTQKMKDWTISPFDDKLPR